MGHGHAEGLAEIELLNAAQKYINSKEAALAGGIMAAAENAALPDALEGSFADVNLLNQVSCVSLNINTIDRVYYFAHCQRVCLMHNNHILYLSCLWKHHLMLFVINYGAP